jgi:SRSO17 transposase
VKNDGQNLQHFMSESSWNSTEIYIEIQRQIASDPRLSGGMLIVDESAEARHDGFSAGVSRQHNGRLGKVDSCQVGVGVVYYQSDMWMLVDAALFMPEKWFDAKHRELWSQLHIPEGLIFETKVGKAKKMILRAKANGLPFSMVCFDELYGRSADLRETLTDAGITYIADVPRDTLVYTQEPVLLEPAHKSGGKLHIDESFKPVKAFTLIDHPDVKFTSQEIRPCERGVLTYDMAFVPVWTVSGGRVFRHWLILRRDSPGAYSYSLSNAPADMPLEELAAWRCQRFYVERTFQDLKSELGWDELEAVKYRSWEHHTVMTALALWFIAPFKLDFREKMCQNKELLEEFELKVLPLISVSNIREILKAGLASNLTVEESLYVVMDKLFNRCLSTNNRLKKRKSKKK